MTDRVQHPEPDRERPAVFDWRDAIRLPPEGAELPATARWVAMAMSFYMDRDTLADCYPGPARLAKETGLTQRTVKKAIALLVDRGWLKRTRKGGTKKDGTRVTSCYTGLFPTAATGSPGKEMTQSTGEGNDPVPGNVLHLTGEGDAQDLVTYLDTDLEGAALAATLVENRQDELPMLLLALDRQHGASAVESALADFAAAGRRFKWPSDLKKAFAAELTTSSQRGPLPNPFELDDNNFAVRVRTA